MEGEISERQSSDDMAAKPTGNKTDLPYEVLKILTTSSNLLKYKDVVRALGVSDADVTQIEYRNKDDIAEQFHQCLRKWEQKEGRDANLHILKHVLKDIGWKSEAEKIEHWEKEQKPDLK